MKRWALMDGDQVTTVTEQDDEPQVFGPWVECGEACPGWRLVGGEFVPPSIGEAP